MFFDSWRNDKKITSQGPSCASRPTDSQISLSFDSLGFRSTKKILQLNNRQQGSRAALESRMPFPWNVSTPQMCLPMIRSAHGIEPQDPILSDASLNRYEDIKQRWRSQQIQNQAKHSNYRRTSWCSWQTVRRASLVMLGGKT
jgi:hypothetical protein